MIQCDQNLLANFPIYKVLSPRQASSVETFSSYDFTVEPQLGKMISRNAPSRLPDYEYVYKMLTARLWATFPLSTVDQENVLLPVFQAAQVFNLVAADVKRRIFNTPIVQYRDFSKAVGLDGPTKEQCKLISGALPYKGKITALADTLLCDRVICSVSNGSG